MPECEIGYNRRTLVAAKMGDGYHQYNDPSDAFAFLEENMTEIHRQTDKRVKELLAKYGGSTIKVEMLEQDPTYMELHKRYLTGTEELCWLGTGKTTDQVVKDSTLGDYHGIIGTDHMRGRRTDKTRNN